MEPVEINAGAWYLRALRDDNRVTDVPALRETGLLWSGDGLTDDAPARFVRDAVTWWAEESRFVWAVCEPTTGELVALIGITKHDAPHDDQAHLTAAHRSGRSEASAVGSAAVTRFVEGALGLTLDAESA